MIDIGKHDYMLFDGECGICTAFSERARRIDHWHRFRLEPYQSFSQAELNMYGLSREKCARKVYVISRRGRLYSGAIAINFFFWHYMPWRLFVLLMYLIPIFLLFEILVYTLVAKHRHRLSAWLGMKACIVRPKSQEG